MIPTQPILHTDRLILSAFEDRDIPDILAYAGNPQVAKTVTWHPHKTREDSRFFLDWTRKSFSVDPGQLSFIWAIRGKETGRAMGSIDFKQTEPHLGQFDYALAFEEWDKGIVTEAARAVMAWAFAHVPELTRFHAICLASNAASRRVMEKCGMELVAVRPKGMVVKGQAVDIAEYARGR